MPELPEVEVTRRGVAPHVIGRSVTAVAVYEPRLRWRVPDALSALAGSRVGALRRRAKYLVFEFGQGCLIVHLGMSGSLRVLPAGTPPGPHDRVDIVFGDRLLRLRDPRRFGAVLWTAGPAEAHPLLAGLGVEPLSRALDASRMHAIARGRRTPIKQLLMDSRRIAGIGNIYANEALFAAGIDPRRRAGRLTRERCARLARSIKLTLRAAIRAGGSSLRDFVASDGRPGYFQMRYRVYDRAGQPCRECGTPIRRIVQGQRATYFCPRCQH